jgi:hypothetical protein
LLLAEADVAADGVVEEEVLLQDKPTWRRRSTVVQVFMSTPS